MSNGLLPKFRLRKRLRQRAHLLEDPRQKKPPCFVMKTRRPKFRQMFAGSAGGLGCARSARNPSIR